MGEKIFLTFADSRMKASAKRITNQAKSMEVYERIISANEFDLDTAFRKSFKSRLILGSRGFGYWCWKPQIILQILDKMDDGDLLQYTDVGCHMNKKGRKRLLDYFALTENSELGVLAFQAIPPTPPLQFDDRQLFDLPDFKWAKGDLLDYFGVRNGKNLINSQTIGATVIFFKKSDSSVNLVKKWQKVIYDDFALIDDTPSKSPNIPGFIEHRHDQAIFSLLCKLNHIHTISAYEYWYPKRESPMEPDWEALSDFPIHARRDKDFGLQDRIIKKIRRVPEKLKRIFALG